MGFIQNLYGRYEDFIDYSEKRLGNNTASIIYVLIAIVTNCAMVIFSKINADELPPVQGQVYRGILVTSLVYIYSKHKGISLDVPDKSKNRLRIIRNLIAGSFNIVLAYIVTKIPMSTCMLIQTSSPFIIAFLDHIFHKTTYTKIEMIFSFVSMSGVIFIIKPDLFFQIDAPNLTQYGYAEGTERLFWIILFVIATILWSGSVVMLKYLKELNPMAMNFPFGICLAVNSALLQVTYEQVKVVSFWLLIQVPIIFGLITFINQHTYVKSIQLGKPAKISMLTNLSVVISFGFEIFYLKESAHWASLIGSVLIVGSSLILSISRLEQSPK